MASDGEVLVPVEIQVDEAQKQLDAFVKKIAKTKLDIKVKTEDLNNAEKQLDDLKAKKEALEKETHGMTQIDLNKKGQWVQRKTETYDEAKIAELDATTKAVAEQEEKVKKLKEEYDKLDDTVKQSAEAMRVLQQFIDKNGGGGEDSGDEESTESAKKAVSEISGMLAGMLKRVFVFSVITSGLRAVRTAMSQLLMSNTELQTSFRELKGNLLTLAQPIVSVLIPVINSAIQALSALIQTIGSAVFAIFGLSWGKVAKNAQKMSTSMAKSAGSAKELKRSLAGIDEINRLDDNSSGGGGGGGASAPIFGSDIKFDPKEALKAVLEGIQTFLKTVAEFFTSKSLMEWAEVGKTIWERVRDTILYVINQIGEALPNIMYSLGQLLAGLVMFVSGIIYGFLTAVWDDVKAYFAPYIEMAGGDIALGFLLGIADGFKNIVIWIKDHIFMPFINGFKEWFRIESPSKVMEELGEYIVEGFKIGVSGIWDAVKDYFVQLYENIKTRVEEAWQTLREGARNTWLRIKEVFSEVGVYFRGVFTNAVNSAWNATKGAWNSFAGAVTNKWNAIKEGFRSGIEAIKMWWASFTDTMASKLSTAWEKIKSAFMKGGQIFTGITDGISAVFRRVVNSLIGGINAVIASPFNTINSVLSTIRNISIAGIQPFYGRIPWISVPQIPYLAQGTVVPPNRQFMAMLGDNKTETEVVSPLSTMKEALAEALAESGGQHVVVNIDGRQLFDIVVNQNNSEVRRTGMTPLLT